MALRRFGLAGALLALAWATNANALGLFFVPTSNTTAVDVGDIVSIDVVMDFAAEPTLGGGFNISYDSSMLALSGFTSNNIGGFENRAPDFLDGLLSAWAFSDFGGLGGPLTVGSVAFEVIADGMSTIDIAQDISGLCGCGFVSAVTLAPYLPGQLDFSSSVAVSTVPVPAAIWFMLSALVALRRLARHCGSVG